MHPAVIAFAKEHKDLIKPPCIDVGALDVNGSLSSVFRINVRTDMRPGPGVDKVVNASDLIQTFGLESFESVVSSDALEHIEDWESALINMWGILKPNGIMFITLANPAKGYHGYPSDHWRWTLDRFCEIFPGPIIGKFIDGPSMGLVTRKAGLLDLSIKPTPVELTNDVFRGNG